MSQAALMEREEDAVPAPAHEPAGPPRDRPALVQTAPAEPPPFIAPPTWKAAAFAGGSILIGLTQGLGLNLVSANLSGIQGSLGATQLEIGWLTAAYMATNVTATLFLYKVRTQFGLRRFAEIGILAYVLVTAAHLFTNDLHSAIAVRAVAGLVAPPLSTLAFFYMLEWLPPSKKLTVGICFGLIGTQLAPSLARVFSPELLQLGDWHGLYLFEVGLALMSLAVIFLLPITQMPRLKIFDREDWVSFPLIALGFGSLSLVLAMGRLYWWLDAPWIGVLLAIAIGSLALLGAFEYHRTHPSIDLRWLGTYDMLAISGSLLLFRFLLSEQTVGAVGLMTALGMQNDQMIPLFWVIVAASLAGYAFTAAVMTPRNGEALHLLALALIAGAALMDAQSTSLTRPEQLFVSQAMIGFAGAVFLPTALLGGFSRALKRGPMSIMSFLVVFLGSQSLGGILSSAVLSTFQVVREKYHSSVIAEQLTLLDPIVAGRVQSYSAALGKALPDPALRGAEGVALLGRAATQEANVLAYNDVFLLIFAAALAGIAALCAHRLYVTIRDNRTAAIPA